MDLPEAILEAGIDLTLRDTKGKVMSPKEVIKAAEIQIAAVATAPPPALAAHVDEFCYECENPVRMQIFKGTGVCCELCRKIRDGLVTQEQAVDIRARTMPRHG